MKNRLLYSIIKGFDDAEGVLRAGQDLGEGVDDESFICRLDKVNLRRSRLKVHRR